MWPLMCHSHMAAEFLYEQGYPSTPITLSPLAQLPVCAFPYICPILTAWIILGVQTIREVQQVKALVFPPELSNFTGKHNCT